MIKLIALTVTLTAFAVGSSFAACGGGSCDKKEDKKKEKPEAVQVINL